MKWRTIAVASKSLIARTSLSSKDFDHLVIWTSHKESSCSSHGSYSVTMTFGNNKNTRIAICNLQNPRNLDTPCKERMQLPLTVLQSLPPQSREPLIMPSPPSIALSVHTCFLCPNHRHSDRGTHDNWKHQKKNATQVVTQKHLRKNTRKVVQDSRLTKSKKEKHEEKPGNEINDRSMDNQTICRRNSSSQIDNTQERLLWWCIDDTGTGKLVFSRGDRARHDFQWDFRDMLKKATTFGWREYTESASCILIRAMMVTLTWRKRACERLSHESDKDESNS